MSLQRSGMPAGLRHIACRSSELTREEVAALSEFEIQRMSESDMARIIRSIRRAHLRDDIAARLPYLDRATLTRLTYLTRRYCQNRAS